MSQNKFHHVSSGLLMNLLQVRQDYLLSVKLKCNYNTNMSNISTIKHTFSILKQTNISKFHNEEWLLKQSTYDGLHLWITLHLKFS